MRTVPFDELSDDDRKAIRSGRFTAGRHRGQVVVQSVRAKRPANLRCVACGMTFTAEKTSQDHVHDVHHTGRIELIFNPEGGTQ